MPSSQAIVLHMALLGILLVSAFVLSASSAPLIYQTSLSGSQSVPPANTKATGLCQVTIINASYASGYFFASNINGMTIAQLHSGAVGVNGSPVAWAFNASYGMISGSMKASFTFNPSLNNISALLAAGQTYFNVLTAAYPGGELRGQFNLKSQITSVNLASCAKTYAVQSGDTCDSIAIANGISTQSLLSLNPSVNSQCTNLQIGQLLCIGSCSKTYTVQNGDTCYSIATANGLSTQSLITLNPSINAQCTNLQIGQLICISSSSSSPPLLTAPPPPPQASLPVLFGYAGARPNGLSPIDPSTIPTAPGIATWVALSFAQDSIGNGNFAFYPGMTITPQQVVSARQKGIKFSASIAGDSSPWVSPQNTWQSNAINSLNGLINTYSLDGIDLNY